MPPETSHAQKRGFRLALAVGTSLVSKAGSILLQLIAIPVAIRVLGIELFGVYAALTTAVSFLTLTGIGVGPGLTRAIAKAHAAGDTTAERGYFTTALFLLILAGLLAATGVYALLHGVASSTLFGEGFAKHQPLIQACAPIVALLVFLEIVLSAIERTQAGYQELHKANLAGAAGNCLGGLLLLCGIHYWPSVQFLMISVLGMLALCRLGNGLVMLTTRGSSLIGGPQSLSTAKARELIKDGLAFTAAQSVAPLLHREGAKLLASHFAGPTGAAIFAILNQISTLLGGFIAMITGPLWPALMDAVHRHDYGWFDSARRKAWAGVLTYAGGAGLVLSLIGTWLIDLWLGGEVKLTAGVLMAFSCYYFAIAWSHVNYVFLTGLGVLIAPAVIAVVEAVLALSLGWLGLQWYGMAGLLWGMAVAMLSLSVWLFPTLLFKRLHLCRSQELPDLKGIDPALSH
jgi:O-antigen/teichoic acid export membrane protein